MGNASTENATEQESHWLPTMAGTTTAYQPEYRCGAWVKGKEVWEEEWHHIPVTQTQGVGSGVPYPGYCGGIYSAIGLFGFAQAMALAWKTRAVADANGDKIQTRIAVYEMTYNIKARLLEGKEVGLAAE